MPEPKAIEPQQMTVVLDQKQITKLQEKGPKDLAEAREFTIETADDYDASASFLNLLDERQKKIMEYFDNEPNGPAYLANKLHRTITGMRSMLAGPYQQAIILIKQRRNEWRTQKEQERQQKELQERETAKAENEARAVEEAKQLAEMGEHEAANTVIERAVNAPPPPVIVPSTVPKQPGLNVRKVWKYRVKNADLHKREFLVLDEKKANTVVSNLGPDAAAIIGGIEVYQDEIETVRRR